MSELRKPKKGLGTVYLLQDKLLHYISSMDIDGTDGHDLLSIALGQVPKEVGDERVQLRDLNVNVQLT